MLKTVGEGCPYCHRSSEIYISHPKSLWEEIAVLLLLRPVRCHDCMRRFYRPLFYPTPMAPTLGTLKRSPQQTDTPKKDKRRSA